VTSTSITDQQARRREILAAINAGIDVGLPVPRDIRLYSDHIDFDSAADLCGWADWLGHTETIPATYGQPHPNLADPAKSDEWLTNVHLRWAGGMLWLGAIDSITDEQRQHWIDSGQAARFAEPAAEDPVGAVVDGGELVPEISVPVHYLEPGADGEDTDRMACGVLFRDAVQNSAFATSPEQVTCPACRKSELLDEPIGTVA
jgi:hypothetical protein